MSQGLVSKIESRNAYVPCAHPERGHDCLFFICSDCGASAELEDLRVEQLLAEDAAVLGLPRDAARGRGGGHLRELHRGRRGLNRIEGHAMESWTLDGPSQRLPVSVLTGFLGSGKTTVLNYLIQQPALSRTLVLINEFGEIGLDHDLVAHSKDDVVIEMSSGCLCCTIRGDLAKTLREAPGRFARGGEPWFDRVVIETTGLADPAPILHTLMTEPAVARRYRLDGVIATVDAVNGGDTLDRQVESVKQAAVADRLLLTKTDLVDRDVLRRLQDRLGGLNPAAPQIVA